MIGVEAADIDEIVSVYGRIELGDELSVIAAAKSWGHGRK